ncbi:MAG: B12 lower ligand biosynthesis radical SAM protein BzaD [Clostridiales bacterium]
MKILMIQSPSVEDQTKERVYPLGISILGTIAQNHGDDVRIVDMNMEKDPFATIIEEIKKDTDLVCISLRNIDPLANKNVSLVPPFITTISLIRAHKPNVKIIAGGTGFSLFAKDLMDIAPIDYGMVGEGEISFPLFLDSFENPPKDLPGLCYYENNTLIINEPEPVFSLDNYISPNYSLLPPTDYAKINQYVPAMGVETRRGCPLKCDYCSYPILQGKTIRCRPVYAIVDEIEKLYKDYNVRYFHFNDPVVNMPEKHLNAICEEILKRKLDIQWTGFFRENLLTKENLALYVKTGCNCFALSPDGLSAHARTVLKKDLTEAQLLNAAKLLADTGVCVLYHFMVNVPGETAESIKESKETMEKIYKIHEKSRSIGTVVLNQIRLLPKTGSAQAAIDEGAISKNDTLLYPLYYNPAPFQNLRYELEIINQKKNTFMWYQIDEGKTK